MQQQLLLDRKLPENINMQNYVGLVSYLEDPFNLFLRLNELEDEEADLVYFFIYSIGKKKIMIWGTYSKSEDDFKIESACKYSLAQLMPIYRYWQQNNFRYVANIVVDRFTPKIHEYVLGESLMSMDEYKRKKLFLAYETGEVDKSYLDKELGKNYPEKVYDKLLLKLAEDGEIDLETEQDPFRTEVFQQALQQYLVDIEEEIEEHEAKINLLDVDRSLNNLPENTLRQLKNITRKFLRKIERSSLVDDKVYSWLPSCPSKDQCQNGVNGSCGVYFYGTQLLDSRDLR